MLSSWTLGGQYCVDPLITYSHFKLQIRQYTGMFIGEGLETAKTASSCKDVWSVALHEGDPWSSTGLLDCV